MIPGTSDFEVECFDCGFWQATMHLPTGYFDDSFGDNGKSYFYCPVCGHQSLHCCLKEVGNV